MKQVSKYYTAQTLYKEGQHPSKVKYTIEQYLKERVNGIPVGIDQRLIFILAKVNLRLEDEQEAEKLFKICIKLDKNDIRAMLELGKLYARQGKEAEAEKLFQEYMELDPKNVHARLELGKLYAKQGKETEAEELFQEIMQIDSKNLHARLELGKLYAKQGKEAEAEKLFKKRMQLDPNNVHARLELGKLYAKQGKEAEAEKLFQECIELDKNNVHARLELGKLYAKQGKDAEAEKLFQEHMQLDPKNVHAKLELGKLYAKQGKEAEAEKLFKEYMVLDPKNLHARLELGILYAKQGKDAEAEKLFQEYMQLDPNNVYARIELAIFYKIRGKKEKSKQLLIECLQINPNDEFAIDQLNKIQAEEETENYISDIEEQIASVVPQSTLVNIDTIYQTESLEEKIRMCRQILEREPDNIEIQMLLASFLEKQQEKEQEEANKQSEGHIETESNVDKSREYILRKDGHVDGLSCMVAKFFDEIPKEEIEDSKKRFTYFKQIGPEEVTMETNKLVWYLHFRYKNFSILERFFRVKDNGEYEAMNSATLVIPNDVQIEKGTIQANQKAYIERQVYKGDYFKLLEEKIHKVEQGYLQRNKEQEH